MIQALNLKTFCVVAECFGNKPYDVYSPHGQFKMQMIRMQGHFQTHLVCHVICCLSRYYRKKLHLSNAEVKNHVW